MAQSVPIRKKLALIVEDDVDQRDLIGALLEELDLEVVGCDSAETALSLLDLCGREMSVLFTDVRLPGMRDGLHLAQEARRRWPHLRVIVSSGFGLPGPLPAGAAFLPKPWRALDVLMKADSPTAH